MLGCQGKGYEKRKKGSCRDLNQFIRSHGKGKEIGELEFLINCLDSRRNGRRAVAGINSQSIHQILWARRMPGAWISSSGKGVKGI